VKTSQYLFCKHWINNIVSGKTPPLNPPSYLPPHGGEKLGRELIVALPQGEGRLEGIPSIPPPPPLTGGGEGEGEKGEGEKGEGEQKGFSFESE